MRVLMKKVDDGSLCCMEVTKITYSVEDSELTLENLEDVVVIPDVSRANAQFIVQTLYSEGKADLSAYSADC